MWENTVKPDRSQMAIRRMRFAWWLTKATETHSECVILYRFSMTTLAIRKRSSVPSQYIGCLVPSQYIRPLVPQQCRIADLITTLTGSIGKMKLGWLACPLTVLLQRRGTSTLICNVLCKLQSVVGLGLLTFCKELADRDVSEGFCVKGNEWLAGCL